MTVGKLILFCSIMPYHLEKLRIFYYNKSCAMPLVSFLFLKLQRQWNTLTVTMVILLIRIGI